MSNVDISTMNIDEILNISSVSTDSNVIKPLLIRKGVYENQENIVDLDAVKMLPIWLIGAGSVGSWVARFLQKFGFSNFTIFDFDYIEAKNTASSSYNYHEVMRREEKRNPNLRIRMERPTKHTNLKVDVLFNELLYQDDNIVWNPIKSIYSNDLDEQIAVFNIEMQKNNFLDSIIEKKDGQNYYTFGQRMFQIKYNKPAFIIFTVDTFEGRLKTVLEARIRFKTLQPPRKLNDQLIIIDSRVGNTKEGEMYVFDAYNDEQLKIWIKTFTVNDYVIEDLFDFENNIYVIDELTQPNSRKFTKPIIEFDEIVVQGTENVCGDRMSIVSSTITASLITAKCQLLMNGKKTYPMLDTPMFDLFDFGIRNFHFTKMDLPRG